jgi:hypothetical protein
MRYVLDCRAKHMREANGCDEQRVNAHARAHEESRETDCVSTSGNRVVGKQGTMGPREGNRGDLLLDPPNQQP